MAYLAVVALVIISVASLSFDSIPELKILTYLTVFIGFTGVRLWKHVWSDERPSRRARWAGLLIVAAGTIAIILTWKPLGNWGAWTDNEHEEVDRLAFTQLGDRLSTADTAVLVSKNHVAGLSDEIQKMDAGLVDYWRPSESYPPTLRAIFAAVEALRLDIPAIDAVTDTAALLTGWKADTLIDLVEHFDPKRHVDSLHGFNKLERERDTLLSTLIADQDTIAAAVISGTVDNKTTTDLVTLDRIERYLTLLRGAYREYDGAVMVSMLKTAGAYKAVYADLYNLNQELLKARYEWTQRIAFGVFLVVILILGWCYLWPYDRRIRLSLEDGSIRIRVAPNETQPDEEQRGHERETFALGIAAVILLIPPLMNEVEVDKIYPEDPIGSFIDNYWYFPNTFTQGFIPREYRPPSAGPGTSGGGGQGGFVASEDSIEASLLRIQDMLAQLEQGLSDRGLQLVGIAQNVDSIRAVTDEALKKRPVE